MPVQGLCVALESDISHPVHANAYLTPGGFPGFTPHYDAHEVFVLQIAGAKHWRIFDPPLPLPHRTQTFTPIGYDLPAPMLEIDLNPGDLLYLPRGYVHAANAVGGYSAHLTIGVTVYTWVELIAELANAARDVPALRAALPPGFAARAELKSGLEQNIRQCLNQLSDKTDFQRLIDGFVHRIVAARARPQPVFNSNMHVIDLQTRLKAPDASEYRIAAEPRGLVMEFSGKKFVLPEKIRTTIEEMCRLQSFRLADLSSSLDHDSKLTLARYLSGERFLTVLD